MPQTIIPTASDSTTSLKVNIQGQIRPLEIVGWICDPNSEDPPTPLTPIGPIRNVPYVLRVSEKVYLCSPGQPSLAVHYECDADQLLLGMK
jgi:hypothetical protein